MKKQLALLIAVMLLVSLVILGGSQLVSASDPMSGAVWTTDNGGTINKNVYDSKEDVWLNGGPFAPGAKGLPDGDYYWKVTTPSGDLLGWSGETTFTVEGGRFTSSFNLWDYNPPTSHFADSPNGEYKVWVSQDPTFPPSQSRTDNFRVKPSGQPVFGSIAGKKFYDANTDGVFDASTEVVIPGWRIELYDGSGALVGIAETTASGAYKFDVLDPGTYVVKEVMPCDKWVNTTPLSYTVVVEEGQEVTGVDFGNVCLGDGGGKTIGFWSNKNGYAQMNDGNDKGASELQLLGSLNLYEFDGSDYKAFRSWLLNANATYMAYMLSAQLAAMTLNVEAGFVDPNALVYAPGSNSANAAGFVSISDLVTEANEALGNPDADRDYLELLKDALDAGNNNLNFVQSAPCSFTYSN